MSNLAKLIKKYPAVVDVQKRAKERIPHVAWEYMDMGTDNDQTLDRNREALRKITFLPRFMRGEMAQDLSTTLFEQPYNVPFGVAPIA